MAQLTWGETVEIMSSLEALYADGGDLAEVAEIRAAHAEAARVAAKRSDDARRIIREMSTRLAQKNAELATPTAEQLAAEEQSAASEAAAARDSVQRASAVVSEAEAAVEAAKQQLAEAEAEVRGTVDGHAADMPRVQNAISLYANVSGIRWHYDAEPEHLAGWMSLPGTDSVRAFAFDLVHEDRFSIANRLWELMDETQAAA